MLDLKNVFKYFEKENLIEIELFNFDYFFENIDILKKNGFHLIEEKNLNYYFEGKKKLVLKINTGYLDLKTKMPDYKDSMVNLVSSFKKYYNRPIEYSTIEDVDNILSEKEYKHVVFLILDGLAPYILNDVLDENSFLRKYFKRSMSAVFPPTTACAIPASASGKLAYQTGWLGWENYFPNLNKHLVLFSGEDYLSHEQTGINIRKDILPYDLFFEDLGVKFDDLEPSFRPDGFLTFRDMLKKIKNISNDNKKTFTYAYWTEPDSTMHRYGVYSNETKEVITKLSNELDELVNNLGDDTVLVITADHGHQDCIPIDLYKFDELYDKLERLPSNEGRALCFKVKSGQEDDFLNLFNLYFKSIYDIYSKEEFLQKGFLGEIKGELNSYLNDFLGNFIAVAKSNYYFSYVHTDFIFKSHHAGITKNEMETPLIIYTKN